MSDQVFEVNCGFFDSINNDRCYSAEQMNEPYKRIITNGVFATPQGIPSTDLQVLTSNDGMNIIVKAGEAVFADKWFKNTTDIPIIVENNNSILPRRDSIIAQVDKTVNGRVGNIVYRCGEVSSNPVPPDINTNTNIIEYRIANIYVGAGATIIGQENITDLRGSEECPWVTSIVKQVDTSELFRQWQSAYNKYYNESTEDFNNYTEMRKDEFDQFLKNLTSQLQVATNVMMLNSNYISTESVTNVPINIPSYDKDTDVLMVFINGLRATENLHYTINQSSTSIDLTAPVLEGQAVNFLVLKSLISADIQTTITLIQNLDRTIATMQTEIEELQRKISEGT